MTPPQSDGEMDVGARSEFADNEADGGSLARRSHRSTSVTQTSAPEERHASAIRYVGEGDQQQREGHLIVLLPLSRPLENDDSVSSRNNSGSQVLQQQQQQQQKRKVLYERVYNELSAFLAFQHIKHRSGAVLPDLPQRTAECDFTWTYRHYDTQFSPLQAAKHLFNHARVIAEDASTATNTNGDTNSTSIRQQLFAEADKEESDRQPFAMMGAAFSSVSETLAALGNAYRLPQISASSTATSLDDMPLFARTIPTNAGDAQAMMAYFRYSLQISTVGVLYVDTAWARSFAHELRTFANQYNVTISTVSYQHEDINGSLEGVMNQLERLHVRYIVGIIEGSSWKPLLRAAYRKGLVGNSQYQWFWGEALEGVTNADFALDASKDWDLAQALHGTGLFQIKDSVHNAFSRALQNAANNRQVRREFVESHSEPEIFDNFDWDVRPNRSLIQHTTYDAVIALGLTACNTPNLFTAEEFYEQLLQVDFKGVSGTIQLDNKTGTRNPSEYELVNILLKSVDHSSSQSQGILSFQTKSSVTIDLSPEIPASANISMSSIPLFNTIETFLYHDNTSTPPLAQPPVVEDMNLILDSARYFGIFLGVLAMSLSILCASWTAAYRKAYVVRAAQPIFLIQICVGTFIVAFTIILLSFQEDMPGLDAVCATIPWTGFIGFGVAISALFSKAARINQVMSSGKKIRRVRVEASDVIRPFLTLMHVDIGILVAWTASPFKLTWQRTPVDNYDEFGRSVESYGSCRPDDSFWFLVFVVPLVVTNFLVLVQCTIASYKGRHLPSEFSESGYVAVAMITLSEVVGIGAITLLSVMDNPTAFFLLSSLVICVGCLSILVPIFLPKYLERDAKEPTQREAQNMMRRRKKANSHGLPENSSLASFQESGNTIFASQPMAIRRTVSKSAKTKGRTSNEVTVIG